MNENKCFSTSDFCLASTLLTFNFTVSNIDKSNPKRALFQFDVSEKLAETVNNYQSKSIQVTPQDFFNAQRELKNYLYQEDYHAS